MVQENDLWFIQDRTHNLYEYVAHSEEAADDPRTLPWIESRAEQQSRWERVQELYEGMIRYSDSD